MLVSRNRSLDRGVPLLMILGTEHSNLISVRRTVFLKHQIIAQLVKKLPTVLLNPKNILAL